MIGVCVKYFHENYGGMLQAYATISMLEARGLNYELIQYEKRRSPVEIAKSIPRLLNGVLLNDKKEALVKKIGEKIHPRFSENNAIRKRAFENFKHKNFTKLSPVYVGYEELCANSNRYSAIITGSDQLWSPAGLPTNYYNLMFVPDDIRKISYASSFGVEQIPWYQNRRTADYLKRIDFISMREKHGSEIVERLTGRKVKTILDPVFNFDESGWKKLIPVNKKVDEPYIFAYFLGANPQHRLSVNHLAAKTGLKIVVLPHLDQYVAADEKFGDIALYDVSPADFLNLLRGADYICTDSYHGMCFSIIHRKKFMIFNRYCDSSKISKNSRIDSLCTELDLQHRRYNGNNIMSILESIDYNSVYINLERLQRITQEYLDRAFNGVF